MNQGPFAPLPKCESGKRCYQDRGSAKATLKKMIREGYSRRGKPSVYLCECGFFHVGNKKPWLKKEATC